jgi:hypothetical protein
VAGERCQQLAGCLQAWRANTAAAAAAAAALFFCACSSSSLLLLQLRLQQRAWLHRGSLQHSLQPGASARSQQGLQLPQQL